VDAHGKFIWLVRMLSSRQCPFPPLQQEPCALVISRPARDHAHTVSHERPQRRCDLENRRARNVEGLPEHRLNSGHKGVRRQVDFDLVIWDSGAWPVELPLCSSRDQSPRRLQPVRLSETAGDRTIRVRRPDRGLLRRGSERGRSSNGPPMTRWCDGSPMTRWSDGSPTTQ
jgi:hypothetical protein